MSDNTQSGLPLNNASNYKETRINPEGAIVKKVIMYGDSGSEIAGFQFFDTNGNMTLQAGWIVGNKKEFELAEGERLVGIKSHLWSGHGSSYPPCQYNLQFMIGWME